MAEMSAKPTLKVTLPEHPATTRASISFPSAVYEEIERIAEAKKVSIAWVVREAAEKYVAEQWPLFGRTSGEGRQ